MGPGVAWHMEVVGVRVVMAGRRHGEAGAEAIDGRRVEVVAAGGAGRRDSWGGDKHGALWFTVRGEGPAAALFARRVG